MGRVDLCLGGVRIAGRSRRDRRSVVSAKLNEVPPAGVPVVTISTIAGGTIGQAHRTRIVNGIPLYERDSSGTYALPTLHADLTFAGPANSLRHERRSTCHKGPPCVHQGNA
jgi:hypothetical protein